MDDEEERLQWQKIEQWERWFIVSGEAVLFVALAWSIWKVCQ